MTQAARTRGLSFLQPVPVRIQTRAQVLRHVLEQVDDAQLNKVRHIYVGLGLLPENLPLRPLLERVLGEQVAGYYDQDRDLLVLRDEVLFSLEDPRSVDAARVAPTIVHELVHALQDQHLGLSEAMAREGTSDADSAFQSLVEGDATLAMLGSVVEAQGTPLSTLTNSPAGMRRFLEEALRSSEQPELRRAPAILRVTLLSSYLDGLLFCAALHREGRWAGVNMAYQRRPVSMEQVLHPDRYLVDEQPDEVALPTQPELLAAGFSALEQDRLGELEMGVYFGQAEDGTDLEAAQGWSGDQLGAFVRNGQVAIVWFSAWDSAAEAQEAEVAARRVAGQHRAHAVRRSGRALLILRHLPPPLQGAVVASFEHFAHALPEAPPQRASRP